jgi:hypothetical protein
MSHSYCAHGIDVENYHCTKCPPGPLEVLRQRLKDHLATLEAGGTISAQQLRDALAELNAYYPPPIHGAPIGGFVAPTPPIKWRTPK